ncbi:MAG: CvpA family protein [Oscillospiraceae bacterium]|nr:CvpA family protein [Oscillospiraceae bacterium]
MNNLSIILDIILVVVLLLCVFEGYKKGFLKSLVGLIGKIASIIVSAYISLPIAQYLYNNIISHRLANIIKNALMAPNQMEAISEFLSHPTITMLSSVGIAIPSAEQLVSFGEDSAVRLFTSGAAADFLTSFIRIVLFVVLMFAFNLIISVVIKLIVKITKLPLIGTVDKTLGVILGIAKGAIWVLIISVVIYVLAVVVQVEFITTSTINNTYILDVITENNPIIKMLFKQ